MTSPHIPASLGVYSIPGVFVTSLQEYSAYVHQWQTYAEGVTREVHLLKTKIVELERRNDNHKAQQEILQRIIDKQQELIHSLEKDLEQHIIPSTTGLSVPISESGTSSPRITFEPETNDYPTDLLALVEVESTSDERLAGADVGHSSNVYDREENPAASY